MRRSVEDCAMLVERHIPVAPAPPKTLRQIAQDIEAADGIDLSARQVGRGIAYLRDLPPDEGSALPLVSSHRGVRYADDAVEVRAYAERRLRRAEASLARIPGGRSEELLALIRQMRGVLDE